MPFRLESASRVTSALATPGTTSPRVAISFRQSGQLPSFTALLEFSKPAEAAPWLALGRLLEAPPDVLPRRWRALYLRAFTASCSQPALGLVVPVELDAFLRRLNLDPQAARPPPSAPRARTPGPVTRPPALDPRRWSCRTSTTSAGRSSRRSPRWSASRVHARCSAPSRAAAGSTTS